MKALEADLVEAGHKFQGGKYYTAGYDDPMKQKDRYWIRIPIQFLINSKLRIKINALVSQSVIHC